MSGVEELRRRVSTIDWWHTIDLGDGVVTPGKDDSPHKLQGIGLPADLTGRSVLDIGAWDGFFSFEAERRGASRVVALDYWSWLTHKAGFELARSVLGSRVEDVELRVEEISTDVLGTFDVVLFLGVLYHVENPTDSLRRVGAVTDELVIVETHLDLLDVARPAAAYYPGDSMYGDTTNVWGLNPPACIAMLREAGFDEAEMVMGPAPRWQRARQALRTRTADPYQRCRGVFHGRKHQASR